MIEFFLRRKLKDLTDGVSAVEMMKSLQRGIERGVDCKDSERLGLFINRARRKKNISIDELATLAGLSREDIIDLKFDTFPKERAIDLIEQVRPFLDFDQKSYARLLLKQNRRK